MGIPVLHPLSFLINSIQNIHGTIDKKSYTVNSDVFDCDIKIKPVMTRF